MPHEMTIPTVTEHGVRVAEHEGLTHYPGCYRDPAHHACALAEIARLKALTQQPEKQTVEIQPTL